MTTDSGDVSRRAAQTIRLDAERFAALFQAVKELPNLTDRPLTDRGLSRELADQALAALRNARGGPPHDRTVVIELGPPDETSAVVGLSASDGTEESRTVVDRAAVRALPALADAVITALGAREFFLRTGYQPGEVAAVLAAFES